MLTKTELAARIKKRRIQLGLSQRRLGEQLEVRWTVVSRWENTDTYPSVPSLANLCRVLRVSADWLLGLHKNQKRT